MKALKALVKPLEAPQRSVKIKTQLNFVTPSGIGAGRVKNILWEMHSSMDERKFV